MIFSNRRRAGFTLLECVITLILASIMGTMMFNYFDALIVKESVESIQRLQNSFELHKAMERITLDYYNLLKKSGNYEKWKSSHSYNIGDTVIASTKTGFYYECTDILGTDSKSGTSEPNWPVKSGATVVDKDVKWKAMEPGQLGNFLVDTLGSNSAMLDGNIHTYNDYGTFALDERVFIKFDGENELEAGDEDPKTLLKVRIKNENSETLTNLFTSSY